jgi:hypothetical protein
MAIGTAAAIGIGLAGVGSAASAISANKASKRAAQTSQANTDANVALARDIYGQNKQVLSPFVNRGNAAGEQLNALLGIGGGQQTMPATQPNALAQFQGYPGGAGMPYGLGDGFIGAGSYLNTPGSIAPQEFVRDTVQGGVQPLPTGASNMAATTAVPQGNAQNNAFDTFRNSTGYQFRLGEGLDAVNSAYAGIGGFQSGAAMRGINEYAQNFASNEFGQYAGLLQGQQAVGAGGASALAGVGQNFAGTVIGQNNFNTQNQMASQLGRQSTVGNVFGTVGGGILGYLEGKN